MSDQPIFKRRKQTVISLAIALVSFGLTYAPVPGLEQSITIVSGTELTEPLQQLEEEFERQHPNINLTLKFQGSQDIANNYIDEKNDFSPTVIIPASREILGDLEQRWRSQNQTEAFYDSPQAIAKTILVGIAWPERGKILFPDGRFSWERLEKALEAGNWQKISSQSNWGSFDFLMTDPTRSNSGQVTLSLWSRSKLGGQSNINAPEVEALITTVKQSVYLPPRSSDILLQEFIARGANEADAATVYESIVLYRWQQAQLSQGQSYQIYYLDPTSETVATAAIVRRNVNPRQLTAARQFIAFLRQLEQQKVFIEYGFRPVVSGIDLRSVSNSPWSQNIPGSEVNPSIKILPSPDSSEIREIQRLWNRNS